MNKDWPVSVAIKLVLILFLPLAMNIGTEGVGYACAVFKLNEVPYYVVPDNLAPLITIPFTLFFLLPGIGFNYLLSHRPDDTSFTKILGASFILLNPFAEVFMILPMLSPLPFDAYYAIQQQAVVAIMACRWGLPILVIIPYLLREVRKLHRTENESETRELSLFGQIGIKDRYDLSVLVLGIFACFAPMVIYASSYTYPSSALQVVMLSGALIYQFTPIPSSTYAIFSVTEMYFPLSPIVTAICMYYVYSIVKYLQNRASKTRCLLAGVIAFVVPLALFSFNMFYPFAEISTFYPLPSTFLVGLLVLILLEPRGIPSGDDFLSKSAWYDEEDATKQEESVRVPISHIISSKVRQCGGTQPPYDWDHETDDVFGEDE